jgi:hypothetical protein
MNSLSARVLKPESTGLVWGVMGDSRGKCLLTGDNGAVKGNR